VRVGNRLPVMNFSRYKRIVVSSHSSLTSFLSYFFFLFTWLLLLEVVQVMAKREKNLIPVVQKLSKPEIQCIVNAFKLYDNNSSGKISTVLAAKLVKALGMQISEDSNHFTSSTTTLHDLILVIDKLMPEPEPILMSSLESFGSFASILQGEDGKQVITPASIAQFMESLGRPPINMNEASLMLNGMLEYDDCAETPVVELDVFNKEVVNFAKKSNAFKDYRG
jgi:hypothetical protein